MPSSTVATSRSSTGCPSLSRDDDVAELLDRLHAPVRAQRDRLRAGLDASAGNLRVLRLQRARDVGDGEVLGLQPRRVQRDVDLARAAADDDDLADAADALELAPQRLVGVFGDVANRLVGRHRERHDRRRVGIELLDRRLLDGARQLRQDAVHAIAHFLRRDVDVLLEQERNDDGRDALPRRSIAARRSR